ncbi:MAG: flagellar motor switch protein FliN [Rubripirellula sp.]
MADSKDPSAQPDAIETASPQTSDPGVASDSLNTDDIEKLLDQATESLEHAAGEKASPQATPAPFSLGDLSPESESAERQPIDLLGEVEMDLRIELGRTQMRLEEVLQLRGGSVVALDKLAGDPVDVFVNGRLIARGEVLVMNDNFCIRVTELVGA